MSATIKQTGKKNNHSESVEADKVQTPPWAISTQCRLNVHIPPPPPPLFFFNLFYEVTKDILCFLKSFLVTSDKQSSLFHISGSLGL